MLRCPVCRLSLARSGSSYRCPRGHTFDVARSGYVNLLRSGRLSRSQRGDLREMLRSRRAFLDAGHYAPLGEELAAIAGEVDATRFLDAGCGDGTFTAHFVGIAGRWREGWGVDIARAAAEMAARRHPSLKFAVASVHDLPFLDGSVTCLLSAFAPSEPHEFRRVLDPAGTLVTVRPGEEHLVELRRLLYRELRAPGRAIAVELVAFEPVAQRELRYRSTLSAEDVYHLLDMTPYARRASIAACQAIVQEAPLQITAHFLVTIFRPVEIPPVAR